MKRVLRESKQAVTIVIALVMFLSMIPASKVYAKQKYKTVKEDGKEYIVFGSYEQDGDESNGKEPIEWEVLGEDKNGILVVSRYILDCQPYNKECTDVTWETCSLRNWLNKEFYKTAFNAKEKKKINTVKIKNADSPYNDTDGGKNTKDKLFCLSLDEILKYYRFNIYYEQNYTDEDGHYDYGYCQNLIIKPTVYAKNKGVWSFDITELDYKAHYKDYGYTKDCINCGGGCWWLRTPGGNSSSASPVDGYGNAVFYYYTSVDSNGIGVRPALYVKK